MNKKYLTVILLLVAASALLIGCGGSGASAGSADTAATDIPPVIKINKVVSAEAALVPVSDTNLAFEAGGRITEILVEEGEAVKAGQVLAHLNNNQALAAIAVAEANLAQAQANLALAQTGPTTEQIAVAGAAVTQAEANLAQVLAGPREATPEQISIAQARVNTLQAALNQTMADAQPETIAASLAGVKQTEAALGLAQADYDKIAYAADSELAQPTVLALQQATYTYEAAQAQHQELLNGATAEQIAIARAQLAEAEAALAQTMAPPLPPTDEQIAVAQAGVLQAEAALAQAKVGPTAEQIAVAQAGVQQAEAALKQAQLTLDQLTVSAPLDGVITDIATEAGEIVNASSPIIRLADLSTWVVETDDLTEIDVVKVKEGQKLNISFDALPDETFTGTVLRIKPVSETKAGDVTYTVVISLDEADPRLRWGMTAFIEIDTE